MIVIMVVTDDHIRLANQEASTYMPYLDSLGAVILHPFGHQPVCGPGRAALFTGQYSRNSGVTENDDMPLHENQMIFSALRRKGVACGLFGKYMNAYPMDPLPDGCYIPSGIHRWYGHRGSGRYYDWQVSDQGEKLSEDNTYDTDVYFEKALDYVETLDRNRPCFLYIAPNAPHGDPDLPTPAVRHENLYPGATPTRSPNYNVLMENPVSWLADSAADPVDQATLDEWDDWQMNGLRALRAVDEGMETLAEGLDAIGRWDETVLIFTADNCNAFGEHRLQEKGRPWQENVDYPLYVRYPGVTGTEKDYLVSNVDLAPTVADIFGATLIRPPDGMSMLPVITGDPTAWRDSLWLDALPQSQVRPEWQAVVADIGADRFKHVQWGDGDSEVYDLRGDPYEMVNVSGTTEYTAIERELGERLATLREHGV